MFWLVLIPFLALSLIITFMILLQDPKQSGLGGLDGGSSGGGMDFSTSGGTQGGLRRSTIYMLVIWVMLALALQVVPR